jgi:hypothetical protein
MRKKTKNELIIEQIEVLLIQLKELSNIPISHKILSHSDRSSMNKFTGLPGKIYELVEDGFFDKPKTISDIQKKLKDRGANEPTTAIMPSLRRFIIKKVLDRNKPDKGIYKYFKK